MQDSPHSRTRSVKILISSKSLNPRHGSSHKWVCHPIRRNRMPLYPSTTASRIPHHHCFLASKSGEFQIGWTQVLCLPPNHKGDWKNESSDFSAVRVRVSSHPIPYHREVSQHRKGIQILKNPKITKTAFMTNLNNEKMCST